MATKQQFEAYLRVQFQGKYNMITDGRAVIATNLPIGTYVEIQSNYADLKAKYPDSVLTIEREVCSTLNIR
jgi:hypothetical protein